MIFWARRSVAIIGILALMLVCGTCGFLVSVSPQAGTTNPLGSLLAGLSTRKSDEVIVAGLEARVANDERLAVEVQPDIIRQEGIADVSRIVAWTDAYERRTSVDVLADLATRDMQREQENRHFWQFLTTCAVTYVLGVWGYQVWHKLELELLEKVRQ